MQTPAGSRSRAGTRALAHAVAGGRWRTAKPSFAQRSTQARASGIVGVNVAVNNHVWGEHATEFLATGTVIRCLGDEHRLSETSPKPTFTLGLDSLVSQPAVQAFAGRQGDEDGAVAAFAGGQADRLCGA